MLQGLNILQLKREVLSGVRQSTVPALCYLTYPNFFVPGTKRIVLTPQGLTLQLTAKYIEPFIHHSRCVASQTRGWRRPAGIDRHQLLPAPLPGQVHPDVMGKGAAGQLATKNHQTAFPCHGSVGMACRLQRDRTVGRRTNGQYGDANTISSTRLTKSRCVRIGSQ